MIKNIESPIPWIHEIEDFNVEKVATRFYYKEKSARSQQNLNFKN